MSNGLCECGCGQKTNVARQTCEKKGWIKGQPVRFIKGHNGGSIHRFPNDTYAPWVREYGLFAPYGECQCGCGELAPVAMQSSAATFMLRGHPRRFAKHHHARISDALEPRFWAKVNKTDDCWEWTGCLNNKSYGQIRVDGKAELAHRVSWEMANGLIADGLCVLHKCDNPKCVRPDHLFLGTIADNNQDKVRKGRQAKLRGENQANAKLTNAQATEMRKLYATGCYSTKTLAPLYGIAAFNVWRIVAGISYAEGK